MHGKGPRATWQALRQVDPASVSDRRRAIEAARLAHKLGDYRLADTWAERAERLATGDKKAEVALQRAEMARKAGRIKACRAFIDRALALDASSAAVRERAAESLQSFGDLAGAEHCLANGSKANEGLSQEPAILLRRASIAALRGQANAANDFAHRAMIAGRANARVHADAGQVFLSIHSFEQAKHCFAQATLLDAKFAQAYVELAFLTLYSGQMDAAVNHAERAVALSPDNPRGQLALATTKLFRGDDPHGLLASFDAVVAHAPTDSEALLLRARARRAAGDFRGALGDLLAAKHAGSEAQNWLVDLELVALGRQAWGFLSIEEFTAMGKDPHAAAFHPPPYWPAVARALPHAEKIGARMLWKLPKTYFTAIARKLGDDFREEEGELAAPRSVRLRLLARECPEELLRLTHGNRSSALTYVDPNTKMLRPLEIRRSARHRAKTAQWEILYVSPDEVLSSFEVIAQEHPRSHHPDAYRGEVLLWLGRYDEAAQDFQRGLAKNPRARWLYIGMGAVQYLRGDIEAALASFRRSIEVAPLLVGPTLLAYRGEALRLSRDPRAAVTDLKTACRDNPTRIGAWVNLWLAEEDSGNVTERDAAFAELLGRARFLLADAADECLGKPLLEVESAVERRKLLEHVLRMMRGNRSSSCLTYFTKDSELRTVMS